MIITVINQLLGDSFLAGEECLKGHLVSVGHLVDFTSHMQNISVIISNKTACGSRISLNFLNSQETLTFYK